ncbi:MAG TPA: trypsin-like peptidase domain-containing protein [Pirellulales bacterium]|nr:trypsin-like peptidase domain-containing protein [Pirellulales bacterium]
MDLHLACPYCNQTVAVGYELAGQMAQCPYCSGEFSVPEEAVPQSPRMPPAAIPGHDVLGAQSGTLASPRSLPPPQRLNATSGGGRSWLIAGALALGAAFIPLAGFGLYLIFKAPASAPVAPQDEAIAQAEMAPEATPASTDSHTVLTGSIVTPAAPAPVAPTVSSQPQPIVAASPSLSATNESANPSPSISTPQTTTGATTPNAPANASLTSTSNPPAATASAPMPTASVSPTGGPGATKRVVQTVEPAVVKIEVPGIGLGSGFVIDDQGTIATNYHVIEGAKTATATFLSDKSKFNVEGFLVVSPGKDLAILKIRPIGRELQSLPLAAARPEKGDAVLAFGAPKGFEGSVSDGIISSVRSGSDIRDLLMGGSKRDIYTDVLGYDQDAIWLQTTAPISGGNSGGPLVNLKGEVVGLNTWNRTDGQNLNFAISAEHIRQVMLSAQSGLRPLSELPKPRKDVGALAMGDGHKTLEYWNKLGDVNRAMYDKLKKFPRPPLPTNARRSRKFFVKMVNFYRHWAEVLPDSAARLKDLDVKDVDPELILLVTADAMIMESIADELRSCALAAEAGRLTIFDTEKIMKKSYGGDGKTIAQAFDILRLKFNLQYSLTFPSIAGDSPRTKPSDNSSDSADDDDDDSAHAAASKPEDPEQRASKSLALAKQMLKNPVSRDAGREKLKKIIEEYPDTKAAAEAKDLLREMPEK